MKSTKLILQCSVLIFLICNINNSLPNITVHKVIIPAAGLGTRCLPITKSVPKELLPIFDTPAIHKIIEEGLDSNIDNFIIIANEDKKAVIHYLSKMPRIENLLERLGKSHLIATTNNLINAGHFTFVPQPQPLGTGHAILMAKELIHDKYFAVSYPDDIFFNKIPPLKRLIAIAKKYQSPVIGVCNVPHHKVNQYGIIRIKRKLEESVFEINGITEKPLSHEAPSSLAACGRYILPRSIFNIIANLKPGAGNEIGLTDGIAELLNQGKRIIAVEIDPPFDIGNTRGWLEANIHYALQYSQYKEHFRALCKKLVDEIN